MKSNCAPVGSLARVASGCLRKQNNAPPANDVFQLMPRVLSPNSSGLHIAAQQRLQFHLSKVGRGLRQRCSELWHMLQVV